MELRRGKNAAPWTGKLIEIGAKLSRQGICDPLKSSKHFQPYKGHIALSIHENRKSTTKSMEL